MIGDTVYAVSSPPGTGARGVLRVSGPEACTAVAELLGEPLARVRAAREARIDVVGFPLDVLLLVMPGPGSSTGEDVVELHLPGSPLLLELLSSKLHDSELSGAARPASPGEFTRRAFENGRLDLAAAEAVLGLIHAASSDERRRALHVLRGGLAEAVDACRARIQDALALLESGLDFEDGETGEVPARAWRSRLDAARDQVERLLRGIPRARPGGDLILVGAANAGKSSLCNALAGRDDVLVAARAGTTRDVVAVELAPRLRLLDAPGDLEGDAGGWDRRAIAMRDELARGAGGALIVVEPGRAGGLAALLARFAELPVVAVVQTKADLWPLAPLPADVPNGVPVFFVSNTSGIGIAELRAFLLDRCAAGGPVGGGERVAAELAGALGSLDRGRSAAAADAPPELVAVDLQAALASLDRVHGRSSPEDLLDRIFARFCLGK